MYLYVGKKKNKKKWQWIVDVNVFINIFMGMKIIFQIN